MGRQLLKLFPACVLGCLLTACGTNPAPGQGLTDARLVERVAVALENASDLPAGALDVRVDGGVVIVSGSVVCDDCGGNLTPGGSATVQQSLGAVVRAVPGVTDVRFDLEYRRP